jgi:two-component system, LytTR family, response regulator
MLRVLLADDEPLSLKRLRRLLQDAPDVELVGCAVDGIEALSLASTLAPDLLILDIEMPGLDGFGAFAALSHPKPELVFCTAYSDYAHRAFDVQALDYLLKPVTQERVFECLQRVQQVLLARNALKEKIQAEARPGAHDRIAFPRIALPMGRHLEYIEPNDIDYLQANANYLSVFVRGREFVLRETLSAMLGRLDQTQFLRIHRSRAVRIGAVTKLSQDALGRLRLTLHSGVELYAGRRMRADLEKRLA